MLVCSVSIMQSSEMFAMKVLSRAGDAKPDCGTDGNGAGSDSSFNRGISEINNCESTLVLHVSYSHSSGLPTPFV